MNKLFKYYKFSINCFSYVKLRQFYQILTKPKITKLVNNIEIDVINDITKVFSKKLVSSEEIYKLLYDVSNNFNLYNNNLTQSLFYKIWTEVKNKNIKVGIRHYNMTLMSYLKNDIEFDPVDILKDLNENEILIDEATYSLLIEKYARMGNMESTRKLVDKMIQLNMPMNATKYSWLIGCAVRIKDSNLKEKYMEEIKVKNLIIPISGFSFIAEAYASILDVDNCINTLKQSEKVHGKYDKFIRNKYQSYYELAKAEASKDDLLKLLSYINETQDKKYVLRFFQKLNRSKFYFYSNFLIKNVNIDLSQEDYKQLAKWIIILQPPFEYMEYLINKIDDKLFDKFLIRYLHPFEEAFNLAKEIIKDQEYADMKSTMLSLFINARSTNEIKNMILVFDFFRSILPKIFLHKFLIIFGIDHMLSVCPNNSYEEVIAMFREGDYDNKNHNIFACCVFHALCNRELEEAKNLIQNHFTVRVKNFKFHYDSFLYFFIKDKSIQDVCQRILVLEQMVDFNIILPFLVQNVFDVYSSPDLVYFLNFLKTTNSDWLSQLVSAENKLKITNEQKILLKQVLENSLSTAFPVTDKFQTHEN